jgi:hypothetical protein
MSKRGKREQMRESFKEFVSEFGDKDILDLDLSLKDKVENVDLVEKTCRCETKNDEDCICYFYNKRRVRELEEKMGREKFRKKQIVDELIQILIEYDCG